MYGQSETAKAAESKTAITVLKVETDNLDKLKNFDWKMVKEMFKENDQNQEITLDFAFVNNSEIDKTKN
jgi:hypothetical protein